MLRSKIVLFNKLTNKFVSMTISRSGFPLPITFCNSIEEAFDFKTTREAFDWSENSGYPSLEVLEWLTK